MEREVDIQKVKERIAKLLRMADDSSSPNEAAIAASRARKLMDKHQLDLAAVAGSEPEEFGAKRATRFYASLPIHLNYLAVAVAKYNDCIAKFDYGVVDYKKGANDHKKVGKALLFQGYANDVELAAQMYQSLCDAVDRLCREYVEPMGLPKFPVGIAKAFKVAATNEISLRLQELTTERDKLVYEGTGTSLVISKTKAVAAYFGDVKYKETRTKSNDDYATRRAQAAGRQAGRTVEINKSVELDD